MASKKKNETPKVAVEYEKGSMVLTTRTGQVLTVPAGAQSAVVTFMVLERPIQNSKGDKSGAFGDTSFSFTAGTVCTTEVATAALVVADGDYHIDYDTGLITTKKADASTSMTCTYKIWVPNSSATLGSATVTVDSEFPTAAALNGTWAKTTPTTISGAALMANDGTNEILVSSGAGTGATAARTISASDDPGVTSLASVDTKLSSQATAAKQDIGNTSIASVDTKLGEVSATPTANTVLGRLKDLLTGIVLSAGTAIIGKVGIDQTTPGTTNAVQANAGTNLNTSALALETGGNLAAIAGKDFATSAKQDTGNTSLSSIDTKLTSQATAANQTTTNGLLTTIDADTGSIDSKLGTLGQKNMAGSAPVVLASDQAAIPVTANAGTNLNTSALALESGGNLASIKRVAGIDIFGLVGKSSGGDFVTAYTSGTTITCSSLPSYHSTLIAADIIAIVQTNSSGAVLNVYNSGDATISVAANVITVTGATFGATDTFIVYTNAERQVTIKALDATNDTVSEKPTTHSNINTAAYASSLVIKGSPGRCYEIRGYNSKATAQFIQVHDASSLPADTAVPEETLQVQGSSPFTITFPRGKSFTTGIVANNSSTGATKTLASADCWFTADFE